jgi:hypothetical protein
MAAHNQWLSTIRSIPYWTTSVFSSTVTNNELLLTHWTSTESRMKNLFSLNHWIHWAPQSQSQSHIAADGQSVSKSWCRTPSWAHGQILITLWQLRSYFVGRPPWREDGPVFCISCWFLPAQSFLDPSPIFYWDFHFRHLLQLAGSRWRYSTPPPHGYIELLLNYDSFITSKGPEYRPPSQTVPLLFSYLLRRKLCLATCYVATTRSLLFVADGTRLPSRRSAIDVHSLSTIQAFRRYLRKHCLPTVIFRHSINSGDRDSGPFHFNRYICIQEARWLLGSNRHSIVYICVNGRSHYHQANTQKAVLST